ncbi:MAG: ABC-F family ATP-binding cassette domain-containing protein [Lachnospiraceae bacterium]|nr:ATP-binding cassette domain-containing protein [uncultured Acetatifactor sp.]MCI9570326.1 ABC-F family ATP-binding cassette domain-containing protein [Lachnospiraceae bacterium]
MTMISISDLTFAYEGSSDNVFEHVSFHMDTEWRLGFTGRNGRGKTTFLRLLLESGKAPGKRALEYTGTISSPVEFEYFPYRTERPEQFTSELAEEILPGCTEPGAIWRLFRELSLLEVKEEVLYRPFATLSHGERTKVLLALLFLKESRFLLIDEPANHLDSHAREILGNYLQKKSGFILVSHDRRLLDTCIDHVLAVNKTGIEIQKGNFSSWWENKKRQDEFEMAENERLKADISRLKESARQARDWADQVEATKIGHKNLDDPKVEKSINRRAYIGEKSRRMQMRRKNLERRRERAIDEKSRLLKNLEETEALKLFPLAYRAERLVCFRDTDIFYGDSQVISGLNLEINRGDRIALCGRNGCGKSSILKLLLQRQEGAVVPHEASDTAGAGTKGDEAGLRQMSGGQAVMSCCGELYLGSGLIVSYVPQDAGALAGSLNSLAEERGLDRKLLNLLLRKMGFSREQLEKDMAAYSEGQKKKVLLAASLASRAHLYIWDEPMNYIDVLSRIQLEELILAYQPTLLFVEHDREFCERIATRQINL